MVSTEYAEVSAGLTEGSSYTCQNVGSSQIEICDAADAAAAAAARAFVLAPLATWVFTADSTDKTWARCPYGASALAINET